MVKEHKSKDKIKGVFNSPLEKANTMEKDDDVISNKSKTKYTNIKVFSLNKTQYFLIE